MARRLSQHRIAPSASSYATVCSALNKLNVLQKKLSKSPIISSGLLLLSMLVAGVVHGHSGATGIVKERMDIMSDLGDMSKRVADMFKGKSEFDKQILADAADAFSQHGTRMAELFPDTKESRTGSKTEALPSIWEDWDEFSKEVTTFIDLSEELENTIAQTDEIKELRKAFFTTTKSCSSCHKRFRKPKN